jgi:predicted amino acid racemase
MHHPILKVDLDQISNNLTDVTELCKGLGITFTTVVKGVCANPTMVDFLMDKGIRDFGSSRLDQLMAIKELARTRKTPISKNDLKLMLIRIPMLSEIRAMVENATSCLISERETLELIETSIGAHVDEPEYADYRTGKRKFGVIMMIEIGDLREGILDKQEILEFAEKASTLKYVELLGIGTNLGCYGAVRSTYQKMEELVSISQYLEDQLGIHLEIISGGGTNTLPLLWENDLPKEMNHLRIGEGILYGYQKGKKKGVACAGFESGTMVLEAEVVEAKDKPTHPMGEILEDAFRRVPTYEDIGTKRKIILAMGKIDYGYTETILPKDHSLELIGASSDHTVLIDHEKKYKLGDIVSFDVCYAAGATLMQSSVHKEFYGG